MIYLMLTQIRGLWSDTSSFKPWWFDFHAHSYNIIILYLILICLFLFFGSIVPEQNNFRHFFVTIAGPRGTAYEGGVFKLEMYLPEEYPMVPPKVHFLTRVYHPNVDRVGRICLDILKVSGVESGVVS